MGIASRRSDRRGASPTHDTSDGDIAVSVTYDELGWPVVESATSEGVELFRRDYTYVRVDGRVVESSYVYSGVHTDGNCAFTVVSEEAEAEYDEGERVVLQRRRTTDACGNTSRSEWTWSYEIVDDVLVSSLATALGSQSTTEYDDCAMPVRVLSAFTSEFVNSYEPGTCVPTTVEVDGVLRYVYIDGRWDRYETAYSVTNFLYEGCL